jgi:hypothetical protein
MIDCETATGDRVVADKGYLESPRNIDRKSILRRLSVVIVVVFILIHVNA